MRSEDIDKGAAKPRARGAGLLACRRGAAIVEFAFIAAPLFAILIAICQVGVVFLAQQELESAVEKSARKLLTGEVQKGKLDQTQFKNTVCGGLTALFNCTQLIVDLQTASAFSSVDTSAPVLTYDSSGNVTNSWKFQTGGVGSVLVLRVIYQFPVVGGPLGFNLANLPNGRRLLMSTAVFQVEPYS
ncbi:pilus biosynthesis protein TadE [Methylosinus sp. C49]|uniref:TadE/TadG family type IV pilus assembly protein n=1 Tax=Methylosinus sp. C49 TaxID=2699395 RepID=UPI001366A684|nr:TadE/TadG family type IV pilus assembly protein [Methylosinus sp. C49]BBU62392.1 pilus biosynthesis protein TadE [Methylosinus sp. C49]